MRPRRTPQPCRRANRRGPTDTAMTTLHRPHPRESCRARPAPATSGDVAAPCPARHFRRHASDTHPDTLKEPHMAIMSDRWIREQALTTGMIEPFVDGQKRDGCISYGLSSYGYDARVSDEFKVFTNIDSVIVDPKDFAANSFVDRKTDCCIIPPNSFALARTVEYFRVPRDVLVICLGKSTYARCGIIVNVT
eukprot:gene44337-56037_t